MRNVTKWTLSAFLALSVASAPAAMAQEGGTAGEAIAEAGVGPFAKESYPEALIDRPLTLPKGMLEASLGVGYARITNPLGGDAIDATSLDLLASFGITDELMVGVSTGFMLDPETDWSKNIDLGAAYLVLDTAKLDIAPSVGVPLVFEDGADTLPGVVIGANTRFVLLDQLYVYGGHGLVPIAFDPSAVDIDLNAGVGFQATGQLAFTVETQLASIALSGDGNETTTMGDFIPLNIGALFAVNKDLDIRANVLFPSVEDAGDFYAIGIAGAYRL